jgi:hypothetical protein
MGQPSGDLTVFFSRLGSQYSCPCVPVLLHATGRCLVGPSSTTRLFFSIRRYACSQPIAIKTNNNASKEQSQASTNDDSDVSESDSD